MLLICYGMWDAEEQDISITGPFGVSINAGATNYTIDQEQLLTKLYGNEFMRGGLMEWLVSRSVFSLHDPRLAQALNEHLCDEIPDTPLRDKISAGQQCAERAVAQRLRELASRRQVPFHYVGIQIDIGIPADPEHRPATGNANACQEGPFRGQRVELTDPTSGHRLEVLATGRYRCSGVGRAPNMQLNARDARILFNGPLQEYQPAIAVILD